MKNLLLITFASLLFACQSQTYTHPESTLEDFNIQQITSNNLKSVKEYQRVPSTNRDSLIEPIGLMLVEESHFNKNGELLSTRCTVCAVQSHGDPPQVDFIKRLAYENGLLKKFTEFEFDTTSFEVQYFKGKSITKGYRDNRQGYTSIESYDSTGRLINQHAFEFFSSYTNDQSVLQVYLRKVAYEYDPETTYKQLFRQMGSVNMITLTNEQFATLKTANIERIENLIKHYELKSNGTEVIKNSESGIIIHRQMHNTNFPAATIYKYDSSGLLDSKITMSNGHESISEYRFEKW
jgi:hypothetical protein